MTRKTKTDDAPPADNRSDALPPDSDAAFREAMGDDPPKVDNPVAAADESGDKVDKGTAKPPRVAKATPRPKRKYKPRAKVTTPPGASVDAAKPKAETRPAATANPRQQAAGFAVGITVMHMALATRVPELALEKGEAEMLGASLDNLCREFGFKPTAKGAAVLAFAGTAMMVYGPKVVAIRKRRAAEKPQRQTRPGANGAATPPTPPDTSLAEIEAATLAARQPPVVN